MRRREFIAAAGAVVPLAGCAERTGGTSTTTTGCDRLRLVDAVETGRLGGFSMTLSPERVAHGERVTVRMENVTSESELTGDRHHVTIQEETADDWRPVFRSHEYAGWSDVGYEQAPGEGFEWTVRASRSGFSDAPNGLDACGTVEPGTYRFVYWAVVPNEGEVSDPDQRYGLGAEFTVTE